MAICNSVDRKWSDFLIYFWGCKYSLSHSSHLPVPQSRMKGSLEEADNRQKFSCPIQHFFSWCCPICVFHLKNNSFMDKGKLQIYAYFLKIILIILKSLFKKSIINNLYEVQIKNSFFPTTSKSMHYIPYYIPRKVFSLSLGHIIKTTV